MMRMPSDYELLRALVLKVGGKITLTSNDINRAYMANLAGGEMIRTMWSDPAKIEVEMYDPNAAVDVTATDVTHTPLLDHRP